MDGSLPEGKLGSPFDVAAKGTERMDCSRHWSCHHSVSPGLCSPGVGRTQVTENGTASVPDVLCPAGRGCAVRHLLMLSSQHSCMKSVSSPACRVSQRAVRSVD